MNTTLITIVLLPGLNGTDGLFQPLVDTKPDHFNVITINYPTNEKSSYEQLSTNVQNQLNSIASPYILVGESFSGPLSLFIAQAKPKNLIGVILVATFVTSPNFKIAKYLPWVLGFTLTRPLYKLRLLFSNSKNASFINAISTELQKVSPIVLADRIHSIFNVNAQQALLSCHVPIMYFRGNHDFVVPLKNLTYISSIKPDIHIVKFNTQHFLLQSAPIQAWHAISNFVNQIV